VNIPGCTANALPTGVCRSCTWAPEETQEADEEDDDEEEAAEEEDHKLASLKSGTIFSLIQRVCSCVSVSVSVCVRERVRAWILILLLLLVSLIACVNNTKA
jgi:hypothetical protein